MSHLPNWSCMKVLCLPLSQQCISSYTRIPNGVIKVITMQDTSSILSPIFYWMHSYTCTSFNLKSVKNNTACNFRGVCDPRKFFDTKVLKSIVLHEHFSIYGNQWLWIRSNWNEYTMT